MIVLDDTIDLRDTEDLRLLAGDEAVLDLTVDPPAIHLGTQGFTLNEEAPPAKQLATVRCFDVVGAAVGLLALSPIIVLVSVGVAATSEGGVIYKSMRAGQGSSRFGALKFRSMNKDAEESLPALLDADPEARVEYERYHKLRDDPRVTRVGRIMRRTSLDELPQLVNVLRGEMSLVGPRPNLLAEVDQFGAAIDTVLRVKPGITGLWQVSGRSNLDFDERIMLDIDYALNRTLLGDLKICVRTLAQMFSTKNNGAY